MKSDQLKNLMEQLISEANALLKRNSELEAKEQSLGKDEFRIREIETQVNRQKAENDRVQKELDSQRQFNVKIAAENVFKGNSLLDREKTLNGNLEIIEEKKKQLVKDELALDEKISQFSELKQEQTQIAEDKLLIEREKAVDRERKNLLDAREKALDEKAQRLKKYSHSV